MTWKERSRDNRSRSRSPSLRQRTSEPQVEENHRHCRSNWFSGSARGPVTSALAGSVRDHFNESCLYEHKDEHIRKLSRFCESLQRSESPSNKFRWETLLAKNPANANSKSSLGLSVNGCDDYNQGLGGFDSHLILESSSKDILEAKDLRTVHMNIGMNKDNNVYDGDATRSYGTNDYSHLSPSRKIDAPIHQTGDVHVPDHQMFESARDFYKGKRNGTSSHGGEASHPHSSARVTESICILQDESQGFHEGRLPLIEPVETGLSIEGLLEYKRARGNCIEHIDDCSQYLKVQPCKRSDIGAALNSSFSQQMVCIPQDDYYQDSTRTSFIMDPVVDGFEGTESYAMGDMEESRSSDHYGFFKESFITEGSYMGNALSAVERDGEVLGRGTGSPPKCEKVAYTGSEKLRLEEDGCRTNYGKCSHEVGLTEDMESSRKLSWKAAYSTKPRVKGKKCFGSDSSKGNVFSRIHFSSGDEKSTVKDIGINLNRRNKRLNDEDTSITLTSFKRALPRRKKSKRRDLKKRLGISDPSSNSLIRERRRNKRPRNTNVNHGCLDVQAADCFEEETKSSTSRPTEDPQVLNQQIKSAFLKFIKVLNENPARRTMFTEPGSGIIKCTVCGSKSKDFVDALSLSQHAFRSLKGLRAEHLGLHKAVCWLMGWSCEAAPNGLWVRRILPYAEDFALKKDLIIWPPVIILHNSSIAIDNTSERVATLCEELQVVIRGMGFGGKIKVVRGGANQSIMVVTFGAMLSGLQEAERLHKYYAENGRGRDELHKINLSHLIVSHRRDDLHVAGANTMESVLYGYSGLAEDLDKLDSETKKRSVVKSKKEIQSIVNESLHF